MNSNVTSNKCQQANDEEMQFLQPWNSFFLIRIDFIQGWKATTRHWVTRKRRKDEKHKRRKDEKHERKRIQKNSEKERSLLTLDLRPFRS